MSKKVPKSPQSNQQNPPACSTPKTWHQTFQKLPSSSKTKACGSSNSGNVPKPPTNTSHRLPFKGHHRLMREASQTTIETSSPLDGNKRNAWLEGVFNDLCCVFWVVALNTLYVWICSMLMYNDVYVYTSIAARGGGGSFKRLKLYNSEEHVPIESFGTTLIHWTFFWWREQSWHLLALSQRATPCDTKF